MSLNKYHAKRNFKLTPEPLGEKNKSSVKLKYLIQKHAASHLHYDFRLEMNGVLKSWAIPKGPSLNPNNKRLAVHVEDHPLEYGSFEGIIPQGQYGGGTVMLWDKGYWKCENDNVNTAYQQGNLTFHLDGMKLKGLWKLIQIKNNPKNWLLIKINDSYAKSGAEITDMQIKSVISHLTIDELAAQYQPLKRPPAIKQVTRVKPKLIAKFEFASYPHLTHPDKILYPEEGITKLDLAHYYDAIHEWILPYIINRPLTLLRCPDGRHHNCFFQKHLSGISDPAIYSIPIREKSGRKLYSYIKNKKGLFALIQLGVLEIHLWGSPIKHIEKPDRIIFDLDPAPDVEWKFVIYTAKLIRKELQKLKLQSFINTTGGKGLHIAVPIKAQYSWEQIKDFTQTFVQYIVSLQPDHYTSLMTKAKRTGKIYIDYLRNQRGATVIAPYSTRARENATIATPLHWDELSSKINPTQYTLLTLPKRLAKLSKDPWDGFTKLRQIIKI
ncbi:MAG: hypothetical protein A3F11_06250 [Gammaproteobacteria bacterium RIFCSPHIGHO2_12_FULL_37_14]|nr:MAG: hypothetical protein A3F11_06250 [Gammaproteobacteria bacterium RIFCSPHIGHO2_12_FULL_37_14]